MKKIVCFGEVLWDVFPTGKKIGGAPLNVALRMKALGCNVAVVSSVGNDANGRDIVHHIKSHGLEPGIQTTGNFPTGVVQVTLNNSGSASYTIAYPAAWDKIRADSQAIGLVERADALVYGSLASRDEDSRDTLIELLSKAKYKVFDVNLRKPHYSIATLEVLMQKADFIKFNDEELLEIAVALGSPFEGLEDNMAFMAEKTNTTALCVTRGSNGAILLWDNQLYSNGGYEVTVADTVGAGDSLLAALLTRLLTGEPPQKAIDFACAMGALVAAEPGANPHISPEQVDGLLATR